MSRKKNDAFSEAVVGLFMIAVLALLAYFTIVISGVDILRGREKITARVAFDSVGGLKDHDSVMYRGTKVGGVEGIVVTPSNLIVRIEVDKSVVLRESYRISVCNLSMLGGEFLMIEEGSGEVVDLADGLLKGDPPTDWMQDVSRIAKNLNELTSSSDLRLIITNIQAASASARAIADRLERGEGALGKLLSSDDTIYRDATNAVSDAKRMLANAAEISDRIRSGEGTVGRLVSTNADLYAELKDSIASFRRACEQVKLPETLDSDVAEITRGANELMTNLNEVAARIKSGEGTIGKLATESEMYDEVQSLVKDVRQVLDNYRDTTPISTFGSLIMGGL